MSRVRPNKPPSACASRSRTRTPSARTKSEPRPPISRRRPDIPTPAARHRDLSSRESGTAEKKMPKNRSIRLHEERANGAETDSSRPAADQRAIGSRALDRYRSFPIALPLKSQTPGIPANGPHHSFHQMNL